VIDLDQDHNIFYLGGSGGFFLLHYIMLYGKHYSFLRLSEDDKTSVENNYKIKLLNNDKEELLKYRCSESYYKAMKGADWPSYDEYLEINLSNLPNTIQQEIFAVHLNEPRSYNNIEVSRDWVDYKFDYIFNKQWKSQGRDWKKFEIWPENNWTRSNQQWQGNKIYFSCCPGTKIEDWTKWPGKKILLWTDLDTQIRMNLYKRAGEFRKKINFPIDSLSAVKTEVKKLKDKSIQINGETVHPLIGQVWDLADYRIKLQDLILSNPFNVDPLPKQVKFKQQWLSLHPSLLLKKSGFL
jgi:hypothetical protein